MMRSKPWWIGLFSLCACVNREPTGVAASFGGAPGPWRPNELTRMLAAVQRVPVVDPPAVSPLGVCTSTNPFACSCRHPACMSARPGTLELNRFLLDRFRVLQPSGVYCCRQNSATTRVPMLSVHASGRAIDLGVPSSTGFANSLEGDRVANWLVENAGHIGIQRVIWNRAYWNGERGFGDLSPASLPHTDHIHVELSIAGANRETPFFTTRMPAATTCTPHCEGTRTVGEDCATVDCAAFGATCAASPTPACTLPTVTEPPEATRVATATAPSARVVGEPGRLTLVAPSRVFDTRAGAVSARLVRAGGATGPITPMSSGTVRDWSGFGLPAGATGVWLNVAAVGVGAPGFVTAFAGDQTRPPTSTVSYETDAASASAAPVTLGAGGAVTFESYSAAHVITDLYGAFSPTGAGLTLSGPTRVLDTRSDVALSPGVRRAVETGAPAGTVGVVASVTVIAGAAPGFITAYACDDALPETSNANFMANSTATNTVVSGLSGGRMCLRSNVEAHVVVDVVGFLVPTGGMSYQAIAPQRLLDTREPTSLYTGRLGTRQEIRLNVRAMPGMPADANAVVATVTAVGADGPGFVTAHACDAPWPGTSSLTYTAQHVATALTVSALGDGWLCLFSNTRTHLVVDVLGAWRGDGTPVTPPVDPNGTVEDPPTTMAVDAGVSPTGDASVAGLPDGARMLSDGAWVIGDGAQVFPDAVLVLPDGAQVFPDAGLALPDGAVVLSDGAVVLPDGALWTGGAVEAPNVTGCACHAGGAASGRGAALWCVAALAGVVRRRRRASEARGRRSE